MDLREMWCEAGDLAELNQVRVRDELLWTWQQNCIFHKSVEFLDHL
jgi:hypothetical protein